MAEQANEYDTKKELEKLNQYRREQETLENRVLLGDEKARLGLAWMYDQPALMEKVSLGVYVSNHLNRSNLTTKR